MKTLHGDVEELADTTKKHERTHADVDEAAIDNDSWSASRAKLREGFDWTVLRLHVQSVVVFHFRLVSRLFGKYMYTDIWSEKPRNWTRS